LGARKEQEGYECSVLDTLGGILGQRSVDDGHEDVA
jgi:hypothetical protein